MLSFKKHTCLSQSKAVIHSIHTYIHTGRVIIATMFYGGTSTHVDGSTITTRHPNKLAPQTPTMVVVVALEAEDSLGMGIVLPQVLWQKNTLLHLPVQRQPRVSKRMMMTVCLNLYGYMKEQVSDLNVEMTICMYVCMHVCMYVCIYVCMHILYKFN